MLAVISDLEARNSDRPKPVHQRRQGPISFPGKFNRLTIVEEACFASNHSVAALRLKTTKLPGVRLVHVFLPEHRLEFRAADLPSQAVDFIVGNRTELPLHLFRNVNSEFAFQE